MVAKQNLLVPWELVKVKHLTVINHLSKTTTRQVFKSEIFFPHTYIKVLQTHVFQIDFGTLIGSSDISIILSNLITLLVAKCYEKMYYQEGENKVNSLYQNETIQLQMATIAFTC